MPSLVAAQAGWLTALRAYLLVLAGGNLVWEAAHLPLYTIWRSGTWRENAFAVVHCTGGDLLIATALVHGCGCADSDGSRPPFSEVPSRVWWEIGVA